tara:strand:- start:605 stop:871 length:267 start_codon:yes stop_codon:yes gene_type:complete
MKLIIYARLTQMKKDKGYWSMKEVCTDIIEQFGHEAGEIARKYILEDVCNIPDEQKYINDSIKESRKQKLRIKLFDRSIEEGKVTLNV